MENISLFILILILAIHFINFSHCNSAKMIKKNMEHQYSVNGLYIIEGTNIIVNTMKYSIPMDDSGIQVKYNIVVPGQIVSYDLCCHDYLGIINCISNGKLGELGKDIEQSNYMFISNNVLNASCDLIITYGI